MEGQLLLTDEKGNMIASSIGAIDLIDCQDATECKSTNTRVLESLQYIRDVVLNSNDGNTKPEDGKYEVDDIQELEDDSGTEVLLTWASFDMIGKGLMFFFLWLCVCV